MGNKLLLADDSITIQKVVGIIFANEDYELTVVDNGIAALEKAREIVPDIILIDALMPGKNGYEVCEEVRRDPTLKCIPLLLLTGAFEPFDEERARQCGADDSISKPFESQHLIDKVRALIVQGKERAKAQPEAETIVTVPQAESAEEPAPSSPSEVVPMTEAVAAETVGDFFTVEEEGGEDIFVCDITAAEEVVEVTPDEDLWGAFDVEEVHEDEAFAFEETATAESVETAAALTPEEEFFFAEESGPTEGGLEPFTAAQEFIPPGEPVADDIFTFAEEPSLSEAGVDSSLQVKEAGEEVFAFADEESGQAGAGAESFAAPQEFVPPGESATEDFFSFAEVAEEISAAESSSVPETESFGDESVDMVPGIETTEEFLAAAAVPQPETQLHAVAAAPEVEQLFAPEEAYVPAVNAPPAATAAVVPVGGEVTLSDEQLTALISRISRDILEKIAWEVVPDLAETIIREEIGKIKEGR